MNFLLPTGVPFGGGAPSSEPTPEPEIEPGAYYAWGNANQSNIFTNGTLSALLNDNSVGDTTTDERSPQSDLMNGTLGIYYGESTTLDQLRFVPGFWGTIAIDFVKYLDLDGSTWLDANISLIPAPSPRASYGQSGQVTIDFDELVCLGIRVGVSASGGVPFSQVGCYDIRGYNDGSNIAP